jgi:hypothetical protein
MITTMINHDHHDQRVIMAIIIYFIILYNALIYFWGLRFIFIKIDDHHF